jgi:putative phosphotransacetylase
MTVADAELFGVTDGEIVKVQTPWERGLVFDNVVIRVDDSFLLDMHIDIDEANAAGLGAGAWGEVIIEKNV